MIPLLRLSDKMNRLYKRIISFAVFIPAFSLVLGCGKTGGQKESVPVSKSLDTSVYQYRVTSCTGNVATSADDELWNRIGIGGICAKGSWVETGDRSSAALEGSLRDVVLLGQRAKVRLILAQLMRYSASSSGLPTRGIQLAYGEVEFAIRKGAGSYIIETPDAAVLVTGTRFVVTVDSVVKSTRVSVSEGTVIVRSNRNIEKADTVRAGQKFDVASFVDARNPAQYMDHDTALQRRRAGIEPGFAQNRTINPDSVHSKLEETAKGLKSSVTAAEADKAQAAMDQERKVFDAAKQDARSGIAREKERVGEVLDTGHAAGAFDELRKRSGK